MASKAIKINNSGISFVQESLSRVKICRGLIEEACLNIRDIEDNFNSNLIQKNVQAVGKSSKMKATLSLITCIFVEKNIV